MLGRLKALFGDQHERSVKARKHILISFGLKGASILISLVMLPLSIDYLGKDQFGIWLTISSVLTWFAFFDLGLGNGLRNKFAEAVAREQHALARTYISTTYALVAGIALLLFGVFWIVNLFVDWSNVLNVAPENATEIAGLVMVVFSFFSLQFVVKLINIVVMADQRPAIAGLINTLASLLSLLFLLALNHFIEGSLIYIATAISLSSLLIPLIASFILFNTRYKTYAPSIKHIDLSQSKGLMSLGFQFLLLQGAAMIVSATDNFIISHIQSPGEVTPYQIAFRYFGVVIQGFSIITMPFWSAYTEAYTKSDWSWIRSTTKKVVLLWFVVLFGLGIMLLLSDLIYEWWVRDESITIPFLISLLMCLWAAISTGTMIFSNFLAGVGKIRISIYHAIFVTVVNIPLSIYFGRDLEMGSAGVMLASLCCIAPRALLQPVQYFKIVNGTAKGIWNK